MELMEHQLKAVAHLRSGKILWGGVGAGKSATVLEYYMRHEAPRHIFVITTAKKRDSLDWEREAAKFGLGYGEDGSVGGQLEVNSWNNIGKYTDVEDAFFVFDEQRLVGTGSWVKSFLKIAKHNHWILLSATPGDTWLDYAPVFVANGFYRNITDFKRQHVLYEPYVKFPKVKAYLGEQKLETLRNDILVEMPYMSKAVRNLNYLNVGHDEELVRTLLRRRWNWLEERPVRDAAELFRLMRRAVNSHTSRLETIRDLLKVHPRLIVFYNFNYELEILRNLWKDTDVYEWNGHKKDPVPGGDGNWVYLVQYTAGSEAWNCTTTNAMVFYSLTNSYKAFEQSQGRIDRLDTPYDILYYYVLVSQNSVDSKILKSLQSKRDFNWRKYMKETYKLDTRSKNF